MKESINVENKNLKEKQTLEQYKTILDGLSGFSRLSENQKRYILNSLYIQKRAERGDDSVSASRIQEMPEGLQQFAPDGVYIAHSKLSTEIKSNIDKGNKGKYFSSQLYIMNEFCHGVINKLEEYRKGELNKSEWYENSPIKSYSELEKLVTLSEEHHKLPFVIQVLKKESKDETSDGIIHTTLLLGKNDKNELIVWEKSGFHMPFQLVALRDVYISYKKYTEWRLRPLSV